MLRVLSLAAALLLVASVAFGGVIDPCASTAESTGGCLLVCPAGDGDLMSDVGGEITIYVIGTDTFPIEGIPGTDFYVIDCDPANDMVLCGGSASSGATGATDATGWTEMIGDVAAGGCADGLAVVVQGWVIEDSPACDEATCLPFEVRSPDMNGDLAVNLQDFGEFGLAYPPNAYDACADFNCDDAVNLQDFGIFGLHYQHAC